MNIEQQAVIFVYQQQGFGVYLRSCNLCDTRNRIIGGHDFSAVVRFQIVGYLLVANTAVNPQQVGVFGQFVLDKVHRRNGN